MHIFPESGFSVLQQRTLIGSYHGPQSQESRVTPGNPSGFRDGHQRITWTRQNRPAARFLTGSHGVRDLLTQGSKMASSGLKNSNTYYSQVGNAAQNPNISWVSSSVEVREGAQRTWHPSPSAHPAWVLTNGPVASDPRGHVRIALPAANVMHTKEAEGDF